MTPLPPQAAAPLGGRSWTLRARADRPAGGEGVLYASGTENSGLSLFVQGDRLVFDYNCFGDHRVAESDREVPVGSVDLGVDFRREGAGAVATLVIDGEAVGSVEIPFAMFIMSSIGPSVGQDHGSPVSSRYAAPFPFTGDLRRVDIRLAGGRASEDAAVAESDGRAAMARQ